MQLLTCICALFAVANATFFDILGKNANSGGTNTGYSHGHIKPLHNGHNNVAEVIKLKFVPKDHGTNYGPGPASAPQIYKVIHQNGGLAINHSPAAATQVIKVIHQKSAPSAVYGPPALSAPAPAPKIIKLIHQRSNIVHPSASAPQVFMVIHQQSAAPARASERVIKVIHQYAPENSASLTASTSVQPQTSYIPPVQSPPLVFRPPAPAPVYGAPPVAALTSHVPAQTYGPPNH